MKIIYDREQGIKDNVALTFGNFDGVHLGHKFAISSLKKVAQEKGLPSAVLTFEPHPSTLLFSRKNFRLINQEQKKELISSYGIDYLYIINFSRGFSEVSCDDFIASVLVNKCCAKHIAVGESCTFGHRRLGTILTLEKYSQVYEYTVTKLEPLIINRRICSSSLIRECLQKGEIEIANKFLGRPYQVSGIVKRGACRGREIGFPTINISIEDQMIKPKFGTYYAKAVFPENGSSWLCGVVNIGMRPTFKDLKKPIIEMHIFDFNENVYNFKVDIELLKFIRAERKFHSIEQLTKQIDRDIMEAYQLRINL